MLLPVALALAAPPAIIVAADGHWAALRRGAVCEAASLSLRGTAGQRPPARASLSFDGPDGARRGQFAVRLNRPARDGASVLLTIGKQPFLLVGRGDWAWSSGTAQETAIIAALRAGGWMSVQSRAANGGSIVDQYDLSGAPTAIDAAAACAAGLAKR